MTREQHVHSVVMKISKIIDEAIFQEELDAGEGIAVLQMLARILQSTVDMNTLLNVNKFRHVSYNSVASRLDGEE